MPFFSRHREHTRSTHNHPRSQMNNDAQQNSDTGTSRNENNYYPSINPPDYSASIPEGHTYSCGADALTPYSEIETIENIHKLVNYGRRLMELQREYAAIPFISKADILYTNTNFLLSLSYTIIALISYFAVTRYIVLAFVPRVALLSIIVFGFIATCIGYYSIRENKRRKEMNDLLIGNIEMEMASIRIAATRCGSDIERRVRDTGLRLSNLNTQMEQQHQTFGEEVVPTYNEVPTYVNGVFTVHDGAANNEQVDNGEPAEEHHQNDGEDTINPEDQN